MKNLIILIITMASFTACKKETTSPAPPITPAQTKTYSVLYKFTSTSAATDFELTYVDASGVKTITNQVSGWTYTVTMNGGAYVSLSALAHTVNCPVKVDIYYDNILLDEKQATGAGTYAYVMASGTLPQ